MQLNENEETQRNERYYLIQGKGREQGRSREHSGRCNCEPSSNFITDSHEREET